jgi:hypothetical protein
MYLKELIEWLEQQNPKATVHHGFGYPMSYRGYYDELAFDPVEETTFGDMLQHARSALGKTFTGYKGGDFKMTGDTRCWIAPYGRTTDDQIGPTILRLWKAQADGGSNG